MIVIHRLAVLLIGFGGIAGDFGFGGFFPGGGIFDRISMDVLRRSSSFPVCIPEDLGYLGRLAVLIFIPGRTVLICGLVAICIGIIDNRLIGDLSIIADSGRPFPFGPALIAYSRRAFCLRGNGQIIRLSFPFHQLFIVLIHGLAFDGIC